MQSCARGWMHQDPTGVNLPSHELEAHAPGVSLANC
jgi:hypothetical protein